MSKKPKVCVGIPSPEHVDYRFQNSLWDMMLANAGEVELYRCGAIGSSIARNRNLLVETALKTGADYMLQIDADSVFPANALPRLLAHDLPIACATTCRRIGEDRSPVCEPLDVGSLLPDQKLVPMKLVGLPFMLIKMEVFKKMRKPWFADPPRWMMAHTFPKSFSVVERNSDELVPEDEYFCVAAHAAGYEIMCDMELSMEIGHVGTTVYYIKNNS